MLKKSVVILACLIVTLTGLSFGADFLERSVRVGESIQLENTRQWGPSSTGLVDIKDGIATARAVGDVFLYGKGVSPDDISMVYLRIVPTLRRFEILERQVSVGVGETLSIEFSLALAEGADTFNEKEILWESDNPNIATVRDFGIISGVAPGTTSVKARYTTGEIAGDVLVTVSSPYDRIEAAEERISLYSGATANFNLIRFPGASTVDNPVIKMNKPNVLRYLGAGDVLALNPGTTQVTAFDPISGLEKRVTIIVKNPIAQMSIQERSIELNEEEKVQQLTLEYRLEEGATEVSSDFFVWSSSRPDVASVDATGQVTARGNGESVITVSTRDGTLVDYVAVKSNVIAAISEPCILGGVRLDRLPGRVNLGERIKVDFVGDLQVSDIPKLKVFVRRGPSDQVTVSEEGIFLNASVEGNNELRIQDTCGHTLVWSFQGKSYLNRIAIDKSPIETYRGGKAAIYLGQSLEMQHVLYPIHGYNLNQLYDQSVKWESDDLDIASFEGSVLTAHDYGEFTIRVSNVDGDRDDELEMIVIPMTIHIELPDEKRLDSGMTYRPEVEYTLPGRGKYEAPFDSTYEIEVLSQFVRRSYLEKEKAYETNLLGMLSLINKKTALVKQEVARHQLRLDKINKMLSFESGEFCGIIESFSFRNGEPFEVVQVEDMEVRGAGSGKAVIRLTTKDNEKTDTMVIRVN